MKKSDDSRGMNRRAFLKAGMVAAAALSLTEADRLL
jgi:hypothetical protein